MNFCELNENLTHKDPSLIVALTLIVIEKNFLIALTHILRKVSLKQSYLFNEVIYRETLRVL